MNEESAADRWEALLADRRRRYLLYCLYRFTPPLQLADIAHQLTIWEIGEPADDHLDERLQIYMALYHDHLPALVDARLVDYHQDKDTVEFGSMAEQREGTLKRVVRSDIAEIQQAERRIVDCERNR
ncbi:hypothetical protein ACFQPA_19580 [Halomarina halobia]|uniref:DUF7344 domain-containing protein n=1 Tax=Halomarina halobia TaxID=3033386 RepID=A0ABD6AG58_9EURY|nr:hypothetical protein [Halomarina sp. PSR21]